VAPIYQGSFFDEWNPAPALTDAVRGVSIKQIPLDKRDTQTNGDYSMSKNIVMRLTVWGIILGASLSLFAADQKREKEVADTIQLFKKTDEGMAKFFDGAAGYALFPTVGKGAIGVGAAHGSGLVYEKGKLIGETSLTQVTLGLQLGGQSYSELIFFETAEALEAFKKGKFALSAQVSAVAAASGASANAKYQLGVAVFTLAKGGLMYEASVGGQKFKFKPIP
jgi:lipid-binding SYLF domain-containing protein